MKKIIIILFLIVSVNNATKCQTSKSELFSTIEKTGGVYYAYPTVVNSHSSIPKGYEPFYISHYGRHGSRYLISDRDYNWVLQSLLTAKNNHVLTTLGLDVYNRLNLVWKEAEGRGGDLSPLGVRQQRAIAERMYYSYPEVFDDNTKITARSTIVLRCVLSMDAFSERLKELNPHIIISRDASNRYMKYLNYHTEASNIFTSDTSSWRKSYHAFEQQHVHPGRLIASLFSDSSYVTKNIDSLAFMWGIYWIASDMQNMETKISFYDLFEKEELFNLWQCVNGSSYFCDANSIQSHGIVIKNAKPLLKNIIETADSAILSNKKSVTLRFGHDGNIIPLVALMHFENCDASTDNFSDIYRYWSNFKIVPMAGNIQLIFFINRQNKDVIVKFMLNEQETHIPIKSDVYPYYHWSNVKEYYSDILNRF